MYARMLVPIDGSPTAERGLAEAIALATQLHSQLVVLHVVDDFPVTLEMSSITAFDAARRGMQKSAEALLAGARQRASEAGVDCETVLREVAGRPANTIVEEAVQGGCSLVVMGTHGRRGLNRLALGSDAEMVLRKAPVPVLLVRSLGLKA